MYLHFLYSQFWYGAGSSNPKLGETRTYLSYMVSTRGGYSVRKLLGVCCGPLKIGPKKIEGKMVFWGQKDRILWGFVPKRSFLCWWMRKNTPKRSSLVPRGSKKGVKTAAHMYHPSYREYPPPWGSVPWLLMTWRSHQGISSYRIFQLHPCSVTGRLYC